MAHYEEFEQLLSEKEQIGNGDMCCYMFTQNECICYNMVKTPDKELLVLKTLTNLKDGSRSCTLLKPEAAKKEIKFFERKR